MSVAAIPITSAKGNGAEDESPSLLEIGRRAAMSAEREAIERVLTQTRWNRRQAAKILKISYKALLNKLKIDGGAERARNKNLIGIKCVPEMPFSTSALVISHEIMHAPSSRENIIHRRYWQHFHVTGDGN